MRLFWFVSLLFIFTLSAWGKYPPMPGSENMAKICASCHQADTNMMRGFLKDIAYKSKTIQMNLFSRQEVVKFSSNTMVSNLESIKDIKNYKKKGFRINFVEKDGEKHAALITRFDILKTIAKKEKLSYSDFRKEMASSKTQVFDVRPGFKYQESHIPGTKSLPAPAFDKLVSRLPKNKNTPLVFYGVGGCLSPTATLKAKSMGYKNVKVYIGGFPNWVQKNYSTTTIPWLKKANKMKIPYVLIDTRKGGGFAQGHLKGAVPITAATINSHIGKMPKQKGAPIILYGKGAESVAVKIVARGYKHVRILKGGFAAAAKAGLPVAKGNVKVAINYIPKQMPGTISKGNLTKLIDGQSSGQLLVDVRNASEFAKASIPGSINIPLDELIERIEEIGNKKPVFICKTGARAEMAHNLYKNRKKKSLFYAKKIAFKGSGYTIK